MSYEPKEEIINTVTHAIGVLLSIYAIVYLVIKSQTAGMVASSAIFGTSLFIMFQASSAYHAISNEKAKRFFRKLDHAAIYILIAGTYTPILLHAMPFPHSIALLAMIWYLAVIGIILSFINLKSKVISTSIYLLMGWLSLFFIYEIFKNTTWEIVSYLILGGLSYTVGSIFYCIKKPYMHAIWHLFVLMGAFLHFICILKIVE